MPNVTLDGPIEASHAALVPCSDKRVNEIACRHATLGAFVNAFHDEFGGQICPTIGLVREAIPHSISNTTSFGAFRDAVCASAVVVGRSLTLKCDSPRGIVYSDAFDIYPWFPGSRPGFEKYVFASTPAVRWSVEAEKLQPHPAPALGNRTSSAEQIDRPLLNALLARWERCFVAGREGVEDRRLFRALEMARAASRTPGGADANEHDAGRSAALWVSAFEILCHDGHRSDLKRVLSRLNSVQWLNPKLKAQDLAVRVSKKETFPTNFAGEVYHRLYRGRCAFLHGEPVTPETLKLSRHRVEWLAASLFRLALTAFLDLSFAETLPDGAREQDRERHDIRRKIFLAPQRLAEDAILIAYEAGQA